MGGWQQTGSARGPSRSAPRPRTHRCAAHTSRRLGKMLPPILSGAKSVASKCLLCTDGCIFFFKVTGGGCGGEGKRGRRVQLSVRRLGSRLARGSLGRPGAPREEAGAAPRFGKLNPALQPRRGALVALRLLRTRWASVLPAPGTSSRVPPTESRRLGDPSEGRGAAAAAGDPCGGARSRRSGLLLVSKPNVKLTVSNRTSTSGWNFLPSLPLGKCRWGRCKGRGVESVQKCIP